MDNPAVFGRILDGTLPATVVHETDSLLCFNDIWPASEHHVLIIPKQRIVHAAALTPADVTLLREMMAAAETIARERGVPSVASARQDGTLSVGFHLWPCISVAHLHMHLIFPMAVYGVGGGCAVNWFSIQGGPVGAYGHQKGGH